jgi:hypothetical protein
MAEKVIPLSVVDARLDWLRAKMKELSMEENMLVQLRGGAVDSNGVQSDRKPTLTDTVIAWVARSPGHSSTEVADAVLAEYASRHEKIGGSEPRKSVLTTIGALVTKGRIAKYADGMLWPV